MSSMLVTKKSLWDASGGKTKCSIDSLYMTSYSIIIHFPCLTLTNSKLSTLLPYMERCENRKEQNVDSSCNYDVIVTFLKVKQYSYSSITQPLYKIEG